MAVLKQTSPTAWPVAPNPVPSRTVPSASTRRAVGGGSDQPEVSCSYVMGGLHNRDAGKRKDAYRVAECCCHDPGNRLEKSNEVNVLRDDINNALKDAMKSGDKRRVSTLRLVNSAVKNADIEARGHGKTLSDDDLLSLLQKMIKQRQESVELYEK